MLITQQNRRGRCLDEVGRLLPVEALEPSQDEIVSLDNL